MGRSATTAGVFLDSLSAWAYNVGVVAGELVVPFGAGGTMPSQFVDPTAVGPNGPGTGASAFGGTVASPFSVFGPDGAPGPMMVVGVSGVITVAGSVGETVQLQTSAGTGITEAISLAALTQWAVFSAATINISLGTIKPHDQLQVATAGAVAPVGVMLISVLKMNK